MNKTENVAVIQKLHVNQKCKTEYYKQYMS
jgi:hypothetical protein